MTGLILNNIVVQTRYLWNCSTVPQVQLSSVLNVIHRQIDAMGWLTIRPRFGQHLSWILRNVIF